MTPIGRYCFNKLPFGLSSAPEHFQKRMSDLLSGIPGIQVHIDDILVPGKTPEEHDQRLWKVLQRIRQAKLTLNREKCLFRQPRVTFLGHVIDGNGVLPDPEKTKAIRELPAPTSISQLRRFMGMINQLNKFSPQITELSKPLRELLSPKRVFVWTHVHEEAFTKVKQEAASPRVLALYDLEKETKTSADASAYGLGAVLLQKHGSDWRPVAFASRALTETESRYAQIEKEALALTWSCEKFSSYILGKPVQLETDHKPLVPILGHKSLDSLPPRVLRFRLRLLRFQYSIFHSPGKSLYLADTLSRAPINGEEEATILAAMEVEEFVNVAIQSLPAGDERLEAYRKAQAEDPECSKIIEFCKSGWPSKHLIKGTVKKYWQVRSSLTLNQNLLLYGSRIVIPQSMRKETMSKIHSGHQGIVRCRLRISESVWWPGASREMENFVQSCPECQKNTPPCKEPLIPSELPKHPWEKVASDLFQLDKTNYVLVVDYFSRYVEVRLTTTSASSVIAALKSIFSRHGVPSVLISDNGPQYDCKEMKEFAGDYCFKHITSSPYHPQSNGLAERAVKTVKELIKNSPDPYKAMLSYRATPLPAYGLSPAELLMGRKIRTDIPQLQKVFIPDWTYLKYFKEVDKLQKEKQKRNFDRRHRVRPLPTLPTDTQVWVDTPNGQIPGRVIEQSQEPRSYRVEVPSGEVRRNRVQLRSRAETRENTQTQETNRTRVSTRSQSGVVTNRPNYFGYS